MVSPPAITVGITLVIGAAGEECLPNASATAPPTTSAHFGQALVVYLAPIMPTVD